ncbi:chemotaxis protein MotC [Ensifer soli]|uniref:chemotaxis protein MotC n=1 Tax=Ciceribacter sp. sgz301302 TaxID=3342379 RepID=UPI0035BA4C2D
MARLSVIASALVPAAMALCLLASGPARATGEDDLPPYKMIRSLEYVQDSVVLGDHSAIEMQRYLLSAIDRRLRAADPAVFDDPRNADAAMIYAMSGGNPETLSFLTARDIEGNFDNRITDALRQYLNGKGAMMVEMLTKAAPEYKDGRLGPYLYLILGNAASISNPKEAMRAYDWARLTAPGTIIEEAALRRSVSIALDTYNSERGFHYALFYARRFMTSPYASQFADLFVEMAVRNYNGSYREKIVEILDFMDPDRRREVYLRIARRAAIAGMKDLASLASQRAQELSGPDDADVLTRAGLYSDLVSVPSTDILTAVKQIETIPEDSLSPRDRALRDAARLVADEVMRAPDPESLTQASGSSVVPQKKTDDGVAGKAADTGEPPAAAPAEPNAAIDSFVTAGRSKLDEIDSLLKGDGLQ